MSIGVTNGQFCCLPDGHVVFVADQETNFDGGLGECLVNWEKKGYDQEKYDSKGIQNTSPNGIAMTAIFWFHGALK
jgi:hypothetical protein